MSETVSVPLWLAIAAALFAAWAAYEKLVVPALRWMVRRPANQVIEELSTRLRIGIRPFQRTRRQALIHRLMTDQKVLQAAERLSREKNLPLEAVLKRVERYAREIVPAFNAYLYFRIGYWIGRGVARSLYRVRLGYVDAAGLATIDPEATVVLVMNHRSNMDYVLAGYLAADQAALSYAVGEWARTWPLSALIRAMGAYFVRRNSTDPLYRRVLERYVAMATEAGVPQAVFPEGGLSRDGRMREPRLGVLDYMLRGFRLDGERDLVFVPLGINYDRVLEDRTLLASLEGNSPGRARTAWQTLKFALHNVALMMRSEWHRFGYACVNFGSPVSMREYCRARGADFQRLAGDERRQAVARLGRDLMEAVGRVVPVVPVALMATVFLHHPGRALSELDLKAEVGRLLERLAASAAHVYVPRRDLDYALTVGLRMLRLRRLVEERDGLFAAREGELALLRYYANSIAHLV
ncbi:MAG TPA: 1-acyl-sn-glycerol-3-phosphate acyltransferase [Burkholderiales bacterium]|jgi:glycerol-3-phosphate O-acyltransferase|nr:1-acyl-sn-glycerol-3-phosphate acyltransferase [Burkholderiales bacterium]